MRKLVLTTALGCLAMATTADAQIVGTAQPGCAYGAVDNDFVLEMARLDMRAWNPRYLA